MWEREMAASSIGSSGGNREESAKAIVADRISQSVVSTSNLLHLMQESSPSQVHLTKLPKNLLARVPTIKNTGQVLQQLPRIISSLDAYVESGFQSASKLKTITQLLSRMESSQLKYTFPTSWQGEEQKVGDSNGDNSSGFEVPSSS